jgi:phage baseplate assembly protein W
MDFGTDIYCINGEFQVLPTGDITLVSDKYCLIQDIINRLKTVKGSHFRHPDYGIDLYKYLKAQWSEEIELEILTLIETELEKDPRILEATAVREYIDMRTFVIKLIVETVNFDSPINLVITLDRDDEDIYIKASKTIEG